MLNLGLIAWRGTSVTLDPFLSLPWPVVLTRAKRVWPSGHRTWGMGQAARNIPMEAGEKGAIVNKPKITGKRLFKMTEIV